MMSISQEENFFPVESTLVKWKHDFFLHCKPNIFYVWFIVCIPFCCFLRCVFLEHQKKNPNNSETQQMKCNVPWWLSGSPWNSFIVNIWTCLFNENFYLDKYCVNLKRLNNYILLFICSLTIMISWGHRLESILISPPPPYPFSIIDNLVKVKSNATSCQETTTPYRKVISHVFWAMTSTTGDIRCKTLTSRWPGVPSKNTLIDNDDAPDW